MNVKYIRDGATASYVILHAKDGTIFRVFGEDGQIDYNDSIYDRIAEADEATALVQLAALSESAEVKVGESKSDAATLLSAITAEIQQ